MYEKMIVEISNNKKHVLTASKGTVPMEPEVGPREIALYQLSSRVVS